MFLQMQPRNKHDQVIYALQNLPYLPEQDSPPLSQDEINKLATLKTSNGDYLFDPDNVKTFYQLVSTILQLKDGEEQLTRAPGDLPAEPSETFKGIGFREALVDLDQNWIFSEEAVHGSRLLQSVRNKIQYNILRAEEEPIVEEGHITCERPGCPSRRITRTDVQTHGSDESSTKFFLCTTCGFIWTN